MLSLRGGYDYVSRSPVHLIHPPPALRTRRSPARLLTGGSNDRSAAAAAVRCRVDSDDFPSGLDRWPPGMPTTAPTVRHRSTSSSSSAAAAAVDGRETTGSILKTSSELHRHRDGGAKVALSRRPRRVRFIDDVSLHRFDSSGGDDVDSAYSSAEYDLRLYPAVPAPRGPWSPGAAGRYVKTATASVPGSNSRWNNNNGDDDDDNNNNRYGAIQSSSVARQQFPVYPLGGVRQQPRDVHVSRNGNLDKTHSTPALQWPGWTSQPPSLHRQPSVVGLSSSGALRTVNHIVVVDPVTRKKKLIVAAKLCGSILSSDVTVKANKNGSRIRITSAPTSRHHHHQHHQLQDLNEQILLPVRVDPYRLIARLDSNGDLVIEAPCAL